jgi:hypothetical protein
MANSQTERSTGSARTVLGTLSTHTDNTRNTAFSLRLSTVWCCGGCGGAAPHHWQGQHKNARVATYQPNQRGVTQLNARGHDNEAPTCNTLEMTMGRWGFFVDVQGRQNNTFGVAKQQMRAMGCDETTKLQITTIDHRNDERATPDQRTYQVLLF